MCCSRKSPPLLHSGMSCMSDIAYWLQNHTGNPSVILFTNEICNWCNKMPFFFMNKCCGSAQKVFTVLSSLVQRLQCLIQNTSYKISFSKKSHNLVTDATDNCRYSRDDLKVRSERPKSLVPTTENT